MRFTMFLSLSNFHVPENMVTEPLNNLSSIWCLMRFFENDSLTSNLLCFLVKMFDMFSLGVILNIQALRHLLI